MSELENRIKTLEQELETLKKFINYEIKTINNRLDGTKIIVQDEIDFKNLWKTNQNFRINIYTTFPKIPILLNKVLKGEFDNRFEKEATIIWDMFMTYSPFEIEEEIKINHYIVDLWYKYASK